MLMENDLLREERFRKLREVDLAAWQSGHGDWFTVRLFGLIAKSDRGNRDRLRLGFPEEVQVVEEWYNGIGQEGENR